MNKNSQNEGQAVELFRLHYSSYVDQLKGFADSYNKLMRGVMPKVVLNDPYYLALERSGKLFAIGAKVEKKLVGVISFIVTTSAHYAKDYKIGKHDFHYVEPSYRATLLPINMLRAAEDQLQELGVRRIFYVDHVRFQSRAGAMRRMGYTLVEQTYEKVLTPKPARGGHAPAQGS